MDADSLAKTTLSVPPERWKNACDHSIFDEKPTSAHTHGHARHLAKLSHVIRHIFKTGQLSVDCNIIALVYIDRLLAAGMPLTVRNWRPVLAISMILASKVWDDLSMINDDFSTFLPFSLAELNKWEVKYLNLLSFNVRVKASEYARFYFDLREQSSAAGASAGGMVLPQNLETLPALPSIQKLHTNLRLSQHLHK